MKPILLTLILSCLSCLAESVTVGKAKTQHEATTNRTLCGYSTTNPHGTNAVTCKNCLRIIAKAK